MSGSNVLDVSRAREVGNMLVEMLEHDGGYSPSEAIPALIQAVIIFAAGRDDLLDEAANLLADGGVTE